MANSESRKTPWFKFFPADWQGDELLSLCSLLARGLLAEFLCLMHKATPYGHLVLHGQPPSDAELSILCRASTADIKRGRRELLDRGVLSVTTDGTLFSRRMVRNSKQAAANSENGKSGARKRWQSNNETNSEIDSESYSKNSSPIASGTRILDPRSGNTDRARAFDPSNPRDVLAASFLEQYPEIYAKARVGGVYRVTHKHYERDLGYACDLASGWPDIDRLRNMLEVFLRRTDIGDKNKPGTPGQFLHMAPDCDALLRRNGR